MSIKPTRFSKLLKWHSGSKCWPRRIGEHTTSRPPTRKKPRNLNLKKKGTQGPPAGPSPGFVFFERRSRIPVALVSSYARWGVLRPGHYRRPAAHSAPATLRRARGRRSGCARCCQCSATSCTACCQWVRTPGPSCHWPAARKPGAWHLAKHSAATWQLQLNSGSPAQWASRCLQWAV